MSTEAGSKRHFRIEYVCKGESLEDKMVRSNAYTKDATTANEALVEFHNDKVTKSYSPVAIYEQHLCKDGVWRDVGPATFSPAPVPGQLPLDWQPLEKAVHALLKHDSTREDAMRANVQSTVAALGGGKVEYLSAYTASQRFDAVYGAIAELKSRTSAVLSQKVAALRALAAAQDEYMAAIGERELLITNSLTAMGYRMEPEVSRQGGAYRLAVDVARAAVDRLGAD